MAQSVSGVNSVEQLIQNILALERRPVDKLITQRSNLNVRTSLFNDLKTKLLSLRSKAQELTQTGALSPFEARSVTSSNTGVLTASASASAQNGAHTIVMNQLASAHTVASNRYNNTDTSISGTTTGTKLFDITVNGVTHTVSVTVNAGDSDETVLANVATAINNAAGSDVTAGAVHPTGATVRLSLASDRTGTSNQMTFTDTDGLLGLLGVTNGAAATDTVGGYIKADLGGNELDAQFTLDGLNLIRESNSVSDALTGVTLNFLSAPGAGTPVTLTVANDTGSVKTKVNDFIAKYNEVVTYLNDKLKVDAQAKVRGDLVGQTAYSSLRMNLRSMMASAVSSVTAGNPQTLSEIGITADSSGLLSISDGTKFDSALTTDVRKVSDLFNSSNGVATKLETLLDGYVNTGGVVEGSKNSVTTQISNINARIDRMEERLALREASLRKQFSQLQEVLNRILQQQSFLQGMLGSIGSGSS
ncbi:MAG TPA: flagellar filament capping protein FliD [Methylomirabilota bacterium]|nr:flagellar filament capping protein FliD [Methylomirabilota bacterium]